MALYTYKAIDSRGKSDPDRAFFPELRQLTFLAIMRSLKEIPHRDHARD